MLLSQPKIPEVGSEFLTVESLKEAAQQGAKVAGFAFSVSLSKLSHSKKGGHVSYILLQCIMGGEYRNNHKITDETRKRIKLNVKTALLLFQKVAYAKEMNIVEEAFGEVKKAAMKSRDPNYIENYLEEWKKNSEC
ncbi:hypothetical protein C2G38_2178854 [Gigaspora rosea]|uniref:Uncharacterized protein n=1 Tax=Gigaspora rosea TaxID=44941 RepID=A0A397VDR8_9GLOM|nr:hypothetical protein C2G38_2178854 [Gigaspora rosea]